MAQVGTSRRNVPTTVRFMQRGIEETSSPRPSPPLREERELLPANPVPHWAAQSGRSARFARAGTSQRDVPTTVMFMDRHFALCTGREFAMVAWRDLGIHQDERGGK